MILKQLLVTFVVLLSSLTVFAAPQIEIGEPEFYFGKFKEGGVDTIKHSFIVKNIGDQPLTIEDVKTTCGCTIVDFDKTISPKSEGKVLMAVEVGKKWRNNIKKTIYVFSNSEEKSQQPLSISMDIIGLITLSKKTLRLENATKRKPLTFEIITEMNNLKIEAVKFADKTKSKKNFPDFIINKVNFKIIKHSGPDKKGFHTYVLAVYPAKPVPEKRRGNFTILTNHPEKPKIDIYGSIE